MFRTSFENRSATSHSLVTTLLISVGLLLPAMAMATNVLIATPLGDIEFELLEDDAPKTVANFLNYVDTDRYVGTFIHRSAPGFVIQGGGFTFDPDTGTAPGIDTFPRIENEFKVSNTKGTVAMAKIGGDPNSASSQWFINLADNSANLDNENGGFTVFARVVGDGMQVAEAIAALNRVDAGGAFTSLPVINFSGGALAAENFVYTDVSRIDSFVMNAGLNDAWFNPDTSGQGFFVTVFPDLNFVSLAWFTYDTALPADGDTANLGDPGHRWITAVGPIEGNRSVMNINITSGGIFDTDTEVQDTDPVGSDGTITLIFDDCGKGVVKYDITSIDQQGTVPIVRVAGDNEAMCEALAAPVEN